MAATLLIETWGSGFFMGFVVAGLLFFALERDGSGPGPDARA